MIRGLFDYVAECQNYVEVNITEIILNKARHILSCADKIYQQFDRPIRLNLRMKGDTHAVAQRDYGGCSTLRAYPIESQIKSQ